MAISDVLKNFRKGDSAPPGAPSDPGSPDNMAADGSDAGPRTISLTPDEMKELSGGQPGGGQEVQCAVTGRVGDNGDFTVISIHSANGPQGQGDENDMAAQVMGMMGQPARVQNQTMPSPS